MKKIVLLFACLLFVPLVVNGQWLVNSFDEYPDTTITFSTDTEKQYLRLFQETTIVHEGTGALKVEWQNQAYDQYGGWMNIAVHPADSGAVFDFSPYTDISVWYYVLEKSSKPNLVTFRVMLYDVGPGASFAENDQEVWMSDHQILDSEPGWNEVKVSMANADAANPYEGPEFYQPGWSGAIDANHILDQDKIHSIVLEWSQNGSLFGTPDDTVSGVLILDKLEVSGVAPMSLVFFNGKNVPSNVSMWVGWSGSAEITDEEAFAEGTNSIKWITGSEWDGVNFGLADVRNLMYNWSTDSVQLKIKAEAGLGTLGLVFGDADEDGAETGDYPFQATYYLDEADLQYDGTWKEVKVPLNEFNRFAGVWDDAIGGMVDGEFDSSKIATFAIVANGQANFADKVVYFDDIWTGNPVFDWIPPAEVTGVSVVPSDCYNLVIWQDVEGEATETYTVYYSEEPITDVTSPNVDVLKEKIPENTQTATHWIYYPLIDKDVTYYYAVECADASGNFGPAGMSGAVTNCGLGVPTISLTVPTNFSADGDLTEWDASGIRPWVLTPETDKVALGEVTDSNDLTATVYLAMDNDNLYIALDVIDDVFAYETTGNWWDWDSFQFFIGLYDQRGRRHTSYGRGDEPDYSIVFLQNKLMHDTNGGATIYTPDDVNYHFEELGGADYIVEAKIPFDSIAFGEDQIFSPVRGMKIPFDLYFHDNDGAEWEGNLAYSPNNTDLGWQNPREWTYTWIGDTTYTTTAIAENHDPFVVREYSLSQNFPNPFNPTTAINFSIPKAGKVTIDIFNTLGQKLLTLVDEHKAAGRYTVELKGNKLPSGIYFYRMQAGDFSKIKKMMLVK